MQVFTDQQQGRPVRSVREEACAADVQRWLQPSEASVPGTVAKVVALNVFKKGAMPPKGETDAASDDRLSPDAARSLLEQLQQARFREARHLRRAEALQYEIRIAQARNEALRAALDVARSGAAGPVVRTEAEETVSDAEQTRGEHEATAPRGFGSALIRMFRARNGAEGLPTLALRWT